MKKILIINTGGTFNKIYNPISGKLDVDKMSTSLQQISSAWLCTLDIVNIIHKDSLEMNEQDRDEIVTTIQNATQSHIIIIHGTDTMDITASKLDTVSLGKSVVLTGAMVPYNISPIEATANLTSAYGFLQGSVSNGIYIAMNGQIDKHHKIEKDRQKGKFVAL